MIFGVLSRRENIQHGDSKVERNEGRRNIPEEIFFGFGLVGSFYI